MGFLKIPGLGTVHYHEYGSGTKPMLAFHGYGMTGKQFQVLEQSVLRQYRVYGFDHFFHGESKLEGWTQQQILAGMPRKMVKAYLEAWFNIHGNQRISLMAYSIGANYALILLEEYAGLVDEIILMAPDGIAGYKGFSFLQHHLAGRMLFHTATKSNWLMPGILKTLKGLRAIDDSLYTIAYNEVNTQRKREDVFYTLNLIRFLQPDMAKVISLINAHGIKCRVIFGRHDMLFPRKAAEHLLAGITNAEVLEVPMGHWLVTDALDKYLINLPE